MYQKMLLGKVVINYMRNVLHPKLGAADSVGHFFTTASPLFTDFIPQNWMAPPQNILIFLATLPRQSEEFFQHFFYECDMAYKEFFCWFRKGVVENLLLQFWSASH